MFESFPSINESSRINLRPEQRYGLVPRTKVDSYKSYRVFNGKQIIDKIMLTTYDRSGILKTVFNRSQMVDYFT